MARRKCFGVQSLPYRYFNSEHEAMRFKQHERDRILWGKDQYEVDAKRNELLLKNMLTDYGHNSNKFQQVHADNMYYYKGAPDVVPQVVNSYQIAIDPNPQLGYIAYVAYTQYSTYYFVRKYDRNKSDVVTYMEALYLFTQHFSYVNLNISNIVIANVFERAWVQEWKRKSIPVKNIDLWVKLIQSIYSKNIKISYHPPSPTESFNLAGVNCYIFLKYNSVIRKLVKPEVYTQWNYKYYEDTTYDTGQFSDKPFQELTHLSNFNLTKDVLR